MIEVSEEFVKSAGILAAAAQQTVTEKTASVSVIAPTAKIVVDTLVTQGLVPAEEKQAAYNGLLNHENALQALNEIAQRSNVKQASNTGTVVEAMGYAEKEADAQYVNTNGEALDGADIAYFQGLGVI